MGNVHTVGPNKAIIISGGCCGARHKKKVQCGGWAWRWWCVSTKAYIDLNVMTLNPKCEDVESLEGVQLTVTGVAQVRVMKMPEDESAVERMPGAKKAALLNLRGEGKKRAKGPDPFLLLASQHFLGRKVEDVKHSLEETMEGHLRAIIGKMTVEQAYADRETFSSEVRENASPDLGKMGIEIVSFTIKDIHDADMYLDSLGKAQVAKVKRDAAIRVANAEKTAGIRESDCTKEAEAVRFAVDTKVAEHRRDFESKQFQFTKETQTKNAAAELAYTLEAMKLEKDIKKEEIQVKVVERMMNIKVEQKEVERKVAELKAEVRLPTEANADKVKLEAEGKKTKEVEVAKANADRLKLIGDANAAAIKAKGNAEAYRMSVKAGAYQRYGENAVTSMVLERLPLIAKKVCDPLKKIKEVVILSGQENKYLPEISNMAAVLPPSIKAITGIDINRAMKTVCENYEVDHTQRSVLQDKKSDKASVKEPQGSNKKASNSDKTLKQSA